MSPWSRRIPTDETPLFPIENSRMLSPRLGASVVESRGGEIGPIPNRRPDVVNYP